MFFICTLFTDDRKRTMAANAQEEYQYWLAKVARNGLYLELASQKMKSDRKV